MKNSLWIVCLVAILVILSGCLSSLQSSGDVTVAVDGGPEQKEIVQEAIGYWEDNGSAYLEDTHNFSVVNDSSAQVEVSFISSSEMDCGYHVTLGETVGCTEDTLPGNVEVRIVDHLDRPAAVETLRHEFGHVQGLDHCDEPWQVMASEVGHCEWSEAQNASVSGGKINYSIGQAPRPEGHIDVSVEIHHVEGRPIITTDSYLETESGQYGAINQNSQDDITLGWEDVTYLSYRIPRDEDIVDWRAR